MELVYRLADISPKAQTVLVVSSMLLGPIIGIVASGSPIAAYWLHGALFYIFLLLSPNVARIFRESQSETKWFFSRTTSLNLAGAGLILVLGIVLLGVPASDLEETSGSSLSTVSMVVTLGMAALVAAVVSLIGYVLRGLGASATNFSSRRKLNVLLKEKLSDGELSDDEYEELVELSDNLGVTKEQFEELRRKAFSEVIAPLLKAIKNDRRMSPEQEAQLNGMAMSHKITPRFDHSMLVFRQLWQIENTGRLELHPIDVGGAIRLVKGEECYLSIPAVWKQLKKRRINTGYVGGSVGFRVAKGVTLRVGRAVPTYRETEALETISLGRLFITNKKILFIGEKKSTNITFGRLAGYEVARDAVQINKTSGKPDVFFMKTEDVEIFDAHMQVL